jgi:uncharacterized membrane protein
MGHWKAYLVLLPIMAVLDLVYLGIVMKPFYDREIGALARREGTAMSPRIPAAVVVYLLIPAGIVLFVRPLLASDDPLWRALLWGSLYGLVLYGVFDFTNRSILEGWSLALTLRDVAWGVVLCALSTAAMHWLVPERVGR